MKVNDNKSHFLMHGGKEETKTKIGSSVINKSQNEKLLGIILDKSFNFKEHIKNSCKRMNQKVHPRTRISIRSPGNLNENHFVKRLLCF